jgi:hypothetical protein
LWSLIASTHGPDRRDELWSHPDHLPNEDDLDNPESFVQRMGEPPTEDTDVDRFLDDVLGRGGDTDQSNKPGSETPL